MAEVHIGPEVVYKPEHDNAHEFEYEEVHFLVLFKCCLVSPTIKGVHH